MSLVHCFFSWRVVDLIVLVAAASTAAAALQIHKREPLIEADVWVNPSTTSMIGLYEKTHFGVSGWVGIANGFIVSMGSDLFRSCGGEEPPYRKRHTSSNCNMQPQLICCIM